MKSILKYIILPLLFTSCIGCENKEHDTPAPNLTDGNSPNTNLKTVNALSSSAGFRSSRRTGTVQ